MNRQLKPPSHRPAKRRPLTRREFLFWTAALAAGTGSGLCSVGGLISFLAARHGRESALALTPLPPPAPKPPAKPPIIPRAQWNARDPNHLAVDELGFADATNPLGWLEYTGDLAEIYNTVVIHHSFPFRSDTTTMRTIQDSHIDTRHWADIGYHFGVGKDGTIYEGRDIHVRGANVAGYNTGTIGVVAIGDYDAEQPTQALLQSIQILVAWLKAEYTLTHLAGHREFNPQTACPGAQMYVYLGMFAQNVGLQRGTGGYVPPPATATTPNSPSTRNIPHEALSGCC